MRSTLPVVLVVDDDRHVLGVLAAMLRSAGYNTLTTTSPQEAMQLLVSFAPITALVVEIDMRGQSGTRLAGELRARQTALPVLFTSATASEDAARDVPQPWVFLAKPFNRDDLATAIRTLLKTR